MKKLMIAAFAASTLLTVPAIAGESTGAGQPNSNANCLAQERATRNSKGGDREQGQFGQEQAAFVAYINSGGTAYGSFGEFLQAWKASCPN